MNSSLATLSGLSLVQIVGLIGLTQTNIPIILDFIGMLAIYLPYVFQIFLPSILFFHHCIQ